MANKKGRQTDSKCTGIRFQAVNPSGRSGCIIGQMATFHDGTFMKISCLVVDDVPLNRDMMHDLISGFDFFDEAASCANAEEALRLIEELEPDVLFLDIAMPGMSGLEFLRSLRHPPVTVFTTSHKEYAAEGYEMNAFDYLVKPISRERFEKCAAKLLAHFKSRMKARPSGQLFVKVKSRYVRVRHSEITFIEAMRDFVVVHTEKAKYVLLQSLKDLMLDLPDEQFLRIHRSYIVPIERIEALEGSSVFIQSHEIPIGESYRNSVFRILLGKTN